MIEERKKEKILRRLAIIKGQLSGIERQVDEERYCVDILTQVAAVQEALRGVSREVVRNHLETCVTEGIRKGESHHVDELESLFFKLNK